MSYLKRRLVIAAITVATVCGHSPLIPSPIAGASDSLANNSISPSNKECASTRYVIGTSVRLLAEAKIDARSIAVLKLNSKLCLIKEAELWSEVKLPGEDARGWLESQYLSNSMTELDTLAAYYFDEESRGNRNKAIQYVEMMLEHPAAENLSVKIDIWERLAALYSGVGNHEMAGKFQALLSETKNKSTYAPGNRIFENWFFSKFPDTSNYETSHEQRQIGNMEIAIILNELDLMISRGGDPVHLMPNLQHYLRSGSLAKLYRDAVLEKDPSFPTRLRESLLKIGVLKLAMKLEPERASGEINQAILTSIPKSRLNHPEIIQLVLSRCGSGEIDRIWREIAVETVKGRPGDFLRCIDHRTGEAFDKHTFLVSTENLARLLLEGHISRGKISELYRRLPVEVRSDWKLIEAMMELRVDLYRGLPPGLRKNSRLREYAGINTSCENIIAVDPSDRELLLASFYRLTEECLQGMSLELKRDLGFAKSLLEKNPLLVEVFETSIQLNPSVIELIAKHATAGRCPYSQLSGRIPIQLIRLLAKANRNCLERLAARDFSDPEIYRFILADRLSFGLLAKLPKEYHSDPAVTIRLPTYYEQWSDTELLAPYINETAILAVAKKWGVSKLAEIKALHTGTLPTNQPDEHEGEQGSETYESEDSYGHYGHSTSSVEQQGASEELMVWSPASFVSPDLWQKLFEIAKKKKTKCSTWKEIWDAWLMEYVSGGMPLIVHMRDMKCPMP